VRKRWVVGIGFVVSVTALFAIAWQQGKEPVYEGKTLRTWLELNSSQVVEAWNGEAERAIRHIGPRAVPWLMKWASCKTPPWRLRLDSVYGRLPERLQSVMVQKAILGANGEVLDLDLAYGFKTLGSQSAAAIPELIELLKEPDRIRVAAMCLGKLGALALPQIMAAFKDPKTSNYSGFVEALSRMGTNAKPAIPMLIEGVKNPDARIARAPAEALGKLKLETDVAVPALISGLEHPDWLVRISCVKLLVAFSEKARPAVPALVRCLHDENVEVVSEAATALGQLGLEAETVIPRLIEHLRNEDPSRYYGALALAKFGSKARAALYDCINEPKTPVELREKAVVSLALAMTKDYQPINGLRQLIEDSSPSVRSAASNALERIAPEVLEAK